MGKDKNQDFHPVRPGCSVGLGDYGYFDSNNCWRRLGNICTIPGMFCTPQNQVFEAKYDARMQYGISFTVGAGAALEVQGVQARCAVSFHEDESYYVRGNVCRQEEYVSLAIEIKEQIEKLKADGKWESNYCVVVSIIYSSSFFGLFASHKGGSADLSVNVAPNVPFNEIAANVGLVGSVDQDSCVFINKLNDGSISPIGFQTVTLSGRKLGFGKRTIKYVGDSTDFQDTCDDEYDEDSEPAIY